MKKALFTGLLLVASLPSNAFDVEAKYKQTCGTCHSQGIVGAPKTGDVAAWKPRLDKGWDVLLKNIKNGLNAMPAKGLCFDCTDEQYKALVDYMSKAK